MKARYLLPLALVAGSGLLGNIAQAEVGKFSLGIEGGAAHADIGAKDTAQTIANLSGSTVTYTYDKFTWMLRPFLDYQFSDNLSVEAGVFYTGDLDATYTLSGASATEAYNMWGLDTALVVKSPGSPLYGKVGVHQSKVNGKASITIGGTQYAASASQSGSGWLVGLGLASKDQKYSFGLTHYGNVGGIDSADVTFFLLGVRF